MSDYVRELEQELIRAGLARQRRRRVLRWTGPASPLPLGRLAGPLTALASLMAVAVAVLALALLGHRHRTPAPAGQGAVIGAQELTARLELLRRPQTAADRRVNRVLVPKVLTPGIAPIVPSLTRLIAKEPGGRLGPMYVYVVVQNPGGTPIGGGTAEWPWSRRLGDGAGVQISSVDRGGGWVDGQPASELTPEYVYVGWAYAAGLVPDGVARVRWTFQQDTRIPPAGRPRTVDTAVRDNVAIAHLGANRNGQVFLQLAAATWYAADGHEVATYNRAAQQSALVTRACAGAAIPARPAALPEEAKTLCGKSTRHLCARYGRPERSLAVSEDLTFGTTRG